jgi:holo-[acyl-carrier protein] synthase
MIIGIGIDIVKVERIEKAIAKNGGRFIKRLFTEKEVAYCEKREKSRYQHYAARFAAKEAVFKAIGTGWRKGVSWSEIEVENLPTGQPTINVFGKIKEIAESKGGKTFHISITHCDEYAISEVVLEN